MYDIPILLVIFSRKNEALKSLDQIRKTKPTHLYISGDGPREHVAGEKERVEETRKAVIDAIDWPCNVTTRFLDHNLGCSRGVYTAINWFFEHEEMGIIIEDDCVMRTSFFTFAKEMLERYKDDNRVGMVDGANYATGIDIPYSYTFSRYKACNGWATWRRAWLLMDIDMKWRQTEYEASVIANMGYKAKDMRYWRYRLKAIDIHDVSAWDWQWYFTLAAHNMLSIIPKHSLTTNIGFGEGATHTSTATAPDYFTSKHELEFPLHHPPYMAPYMPFEKAFYHSNNTLFNRIKQLFPFAFKNMIKRIVRR